YRSAHGSGQQRPVGGKPFPSSPPCGWFRQAGLPRAGNLPTLYRLGLSALGKRHGRGERERGGMGERRLWAGGRYQGRLAEAVSAFDQVKSADPSKEASLWQRGIALYLNGRIAAAHSRRFPPSSLPP